MAVSVIDVQRPREDTFGDLARSPVVTDDDRDREWLDLVIKAMHRSEYSHKAAASDLGIDRGLLSAQLSAAPNKHLSFRRMWRLSPAFWRELLMLVADFQAVTIGQTQRDADDAAIGRLVRDAVLRSVGR